MAGLLTFLTDFADQAVILPMFAAVALVLAVQRRWRVAGAWTVAVAGVLGAMLVLKLADQACGWRVPLLGPGALDLVSPSGHTASAAVVGGCVLALLLAGPRAALVAAGAAIGFAALIGWTRLGLGVHTLSEVVLGGMVGAAGAGAFAVLAGPRLLAPSGTLPVLAALAILGLLHGQHLAAEPTIHGTAVGVIRGYLPACRPSV